MGILSVDTSSYILMRKTIQNDVQKKKGSIIMKTIFKLVKSIALLVFCYIAVVIAIIPFLTVNYNPSAAVVVTSIIVFLGMSKVSVIQKKKVAALFAEMREARRANALTHSFAA